METKIINVSIGRTIEATQYDAGQVLVFDGIDIPDGSEAHFSNQKINEKTVINNNQCDIPDDILQISGKGMLSVYVINEDSSRTVYDFLILIKKRAELPDGIAPEHQQSFEEKVIGIFNDAKSLAESAKKEAQSVREDADAGLFNGKDYNLTDEDREEIADKVENELDYVKPTRKIANETLENDITVAQLVNSMTADPEGLLRTFVGTQIINNALVKGKADKSYVDELVSSLTLLDVKKVDVLPTSDISTSTIYLVPAATALEQNMYEEYIYVDGNWEHIGNTNVDLSGYVQNNRKIANIPLSGDISAQTLYNALLVCFNNSTFAGMVLAAGYGTIQSYIAANEAVKLNTESRHIHSNKEFLDKLTASSFDWELILDKTLPAQSSDGTLLDFEDLILDGTYKELKFITVMWTSASGAANLYVNNGTEPAVTLQGVLGTGATFTYEFILQDTDLPGRYLLLTAERTISGVKATNSEVKTYQNSGSDETVPNVKNIKSLKLELGSGWSNTSARYIRVYGRK